MNTNPILHRRGALMMLGLSTLAALSACVVEPPRRVVVHETVLQQPRPVVREMPQPVREERGAPPAPGAAWVPGHWKWNGNEWFWVLGKWVQQAVPPMPPVIVEEISPAPSPRHFWVPGHWVWRFEGNGGWIWVRGGWHG